MTTWFYYVAIPDSMFRKLSKFIWKRCNRKCWSIHHIRQALRYSLNLGEEFFRRGIRPLSERLQGSGKRCMNEPQYFHNKLLCFAKTKCYQFLVIFFNSSHDAPRSLHSLHYSTPPLGLVGFIAWHNPQQSCCPFLMGVLLSSTFSAFSTTRASSPFVIVSDQNISMTRR